VNQSHFGVSDIDEMDSGIFEYLLGELLNIISEKGKGFTNVKGNNNLRDFYYRDIVLGEQNEEVNNQQITLKLL